VCIIKITTICKHLLKKILHIDKSADRGKALKHTLGQPIAFEPNHRQDADLIFLAASAQDARQIVPFLNYYFADEIPIFATASVFDGVDRNHFNRDMNQVYFFDSPWMLDTHQRYAAMRQQIQQFWPQRFSQHARVYGLGIDAFDLIFSLRHLEKYKQLGLQGTSGHLVLDNNNHIKRHLLFAQFVQGHPKLL